MVSLNLLTVAGYCQSYISRKISLVLSPYHHFKYTFADVYLFTKTLISPNIVWIWHFIIIVFLTYQQRLCDWAHNLKHEFHYVCMKMKFVFEMDKGDLHRIPVWTIYSSITLRTTRLFVNEREIWVSTYISCYVT